jgi:V/A-type H+-transporting ATPase subunit E
MSEMKLSNISIYEKIEIKGEQDVKKIYASGEEKAKVLEETILNDANSKIDQLIKKCIERNENKIQTKTTEFDQQAKQKFLFKKKETIDKVIHLVHLKLNQLNDEMLIKLIVKLIQTEDIQGNEVIKVSKEDHSRYVRLFSSGKLINDNYLLDNLNQYLKNEKYQIKLAKEYADINGGFIIIGENYDIDHSYQTMLENMKEKYETEIAKLLFDSGE